MRKYIQVMNTYLRTQLVWRTDAFLTMIFSVAKIMFAYLLWGVIFQNKTEVSGFTFQSMISYYLISSFLSQLDMSSNVSNDIHNKIRNGTFSKYMILPIQLPAYFLAMELGSIIFYLGFDLVAAILWIILFQIELTLTSHVITILLALLMVMIGLYFMLQLNIYLGLLTLKYQEIGCFLMIKNNIMSLVTGGLIPLALFPEALIQIFRVLPFYYISYLPSMLLIGKYESEALLGVLIILVWAVSFRILNQVTYQRYRMKFDGAGM